MLNYWIIKQRDYWKLGIENWKLAIVLPEINRLSQKKDFAVVFKSGKGVKGNFLIFKILKNNSNKLRVGFIVSKKVSNKATIRNKVKRRLRAAVLGELKKNNLSADIIVIALSGARDRNILEIQKEISKIFKS